ncbi:MAG: aspartate-semialdehyde dehydrogenase [Candidatus Omnitrophica bacterium]|nr:aspartate-semialdehyde dehydrogenase [Candidatus Omnitrophota bacterium]
MKNKKLRVAILGVTGAVGQEFLSILEERKFPLAELKVLASERSAGKNVKFLGKWMTVQAAAPESFKGIDLVLSSAGATVSRRLVPEAVKAGAVVIDNTSAFRMDASVPLVIPEINASEISKHKGIIANPNCSTIVMAVPLYPLHEAARARRVIVSTYQAASGAGMKAMRELEEQTREVLAGKKPAPKVFRHPIAFNLFSHDSAIREDGFTEEEYKMIQETRKIFRTPELKIVATTIRVPVLRAHSESIVVEFERPLSEEEAKKILQKSPGVEVVDRRKENYFPMPIEASGKDNILVGRIRKDPSSENGLAFFVSGDQLRKGAALNAVQIAEILFS